MNQELWPFVIILLILLIALLQFVLQRDLQSDRVKALEARLTEVESQLAALLQRLVH